MIGANPHSSFESDIFLERLLAWTSLVFLRLLSLCFIALTFYVWLRAVGYWPVPENRFDTMSPGLKVITALLSVLFPVSAVGLWTILPWGRVVWLLSVAVQFLAFAGIFGAVFMPVEVIYAHSATIAIFFAIQLGLYLITKKA